MLIEEKRQQLDSIVQQMTQNRESDDTIQFVVNDFKNRHSVEESETSFLEKTEKVLDTLFGGGKVGEAIGAGIAKTKIGRKLIGAPEIPEEAEKFIKAPPIGEIAGSALQSAALFAPIGTLAKGITAAARGLGLVKGVSALGKIGAGALTGEIFDVALNLQQGKIGKEALTPGLGTLIGGGIPTLGVAKNVVVRFGERQAPRIINSLIKPLAKDFSYGKNPGRAVAEEGIIANNFDDLIDNIRASRQKIGQSIGFLSSKLSERPLLNIELALNPLDDAVKVAAKQNNPTLLQRLNNVKRAITDVLEPVVDDTGNLGIKSVGYRNLDSLTFKQTRNLLSEIGDMTQFTGNPSDDKLVNSALKQVYGKIKETSLKYAEAVNPELAKEFSKLTEKYADLHSAEIAAKYRDKIVERQNLIGLTPTVAGLGSGLITAIATGGATIPSAIVGISAAVIDKLSATPGFKTRLAYILSKKTQQEANFLFRKIPALSKFFSTEKGIFPGDILLGENGEVLERGIAEFIKKPKIGLSIEDVSGFGQTLRGTKGLTADQIMQKFPDIQLKRDISATDIYGNKVKIPEGEALTPYELKGNKILLQDGDTYIVSKNQFQNIKGQSIVGEAKEFAPELQGLEESVKNVLDEKEMALKQYGKGYSKLTDEQRVATRNLVRQQAEPKFSQYQLPEGKNYKEILIKAPGGIFKDPHFGEPTISHLRLNERTYKGQKVTFMEEAQSDWARAGREKGFATEITKDTAKQQGFTVKKSKSTTGDEAYFIDNPTDQYFYRKGFPNTGFNTEAEAWNSVTKKLKETSGAVPYHPLVEGGKWVEPTVKRGLREAVDNDSAYFAWITGEQTSARYNLATQLRDVKWRKMDERSLVNKNKIITLQPKDKVGEMVVKIDKNGLIVGGEKNTPSSWDGKKLDEVLGKGLADSIMAKESGTLSGEGLKFGGEWATNLYDKQIKNIVEDVTGGKVELLDMGLPIEAKEGVGFWLKNPQGGQGTKIAIKDLKVGKEIMKGMGEPYIITDILGEGKFKAVPKSSGTNNKFDKFDKEFDDMWYDTSKAETFSTKTTTQQGIKLTPEIKAKILGEAPKIKTSGEQYAN